jgi:hypothetical protein
MEKQKKHITHTKQNLESLSTLVLILNRDIFLYYNQQEAAYDRS